MGFYFVFSFVCAEHCYLWLRTYPLKTFPASAFFNNNSSAFKHPNFVEEAIEELLRKRCIDEHDNAPHVVNPLTVVEGKKLKFVLDLPKSLSEIFGSGFYFFTFDLESGYHHVGIVQHHQQFLGFSRLFSHGARRYFTFKVLPFGLSSACFVFAKLLRPLVTCWQSMGHVSLVYIDDGISGARDRVSARAASLIERRILSLLALNVMRVRVIWSPDKSGSG